MTPSLDDLIPVVLYHMYEATVRDNYAVMEPSYLAGVIQNGVTPAFVRIALEQLEDLKEIKFVPKQSLVPIQNVPSPAKLTPSGIRRVERDLRDESSSIFRYSSDGLEAFAETSIPFFDVPASDRMVSLDHNSAAYREIAEGLDEAITVASNTRPNGVTGDQHSSLVSALRSAKELWDAYELTYLQVEVGVLLAVERAQEFLKISFQMARGSLLVEAVKLFINGLQQAKF